MKKILVLMLVLGVASMATAALTLSGPTQVVAGQTVTITMSADAESVTNGDYGYVYVGSDSFDSVVMLTSMSDGDMSGLSYTGNTYTYFYFVGADNPSDTDAPWLSAGNWVSFDVTADSTTVGGTIVITASSNWGYDGDTQNILVIPEPMTIGLLGLGGLFLRRRK